MTAYGIAWLVVAGAGLVAAVLIFIVVRRWTRLRYLAAGLVIAWALTPHRFDDEHLAPAIVVAVFRQFLEDGANPLPPLLLLAAATIGVVAVWLAVIIMLAFSATKPRRPQRHFTRG